MLALFICAPSGGGPSRAFLEWAYGNAEGLGKRVRTRIQVLARQWVPDSASGQVERVAVWFALVGAAGELATEAQLTGWPVDESAQVARMCFEAWLRARGGAGNEWVVSMLWARAPLSGIAR